MSKNSVSEWSTVSSGNGDIAGLTLGLDMPPSYVNNAIQEMMAQIKQWKDGYTDPITGEPVYQSLSVENIDVVGDIHVEGVTNIKGEFKLNGSSGTLGQVMVSKGDDLTPEWGNAFVVGMIMLWSGSSVPSGWRLCNGANGTPNLRNRFVIGAGSIYDSGDTGGSADSDLQAHTHTMTEAGDHKHQVGAGSTAYGATGGAVRGSGAGAQSLSSREPDHVHTIRSTGSGDGENKNLPPYYALAYIMKV